ncbi:SRPBCC domain-containing protein [Sorangium sp. So ce1151]
MFKAWTDPELLKQWFAPEPFTTPVAELDLRPGGANLIVMRDPQGNEYPNQGLYLEPESSRTRGPPGAERRPGAALSGLSSQP